jgi:hypothetical protein
MGRSIAFFTTKQDLLDVLQSVEEDSPLYYVRWGYYPSPTAPTFSSASEVPELGTPTRPHRGEDRYFVFPRWVPLIFREVNRSTGVTEFATEPPANVPWVHLHSGGLYGEEGLVEGIIESPLTRREELRLFDTLSRAIRKRFMRVESSNMGTSYVGPQALKLLRGGMRFVRNSILSLKDLDFELPRGWRPAEPDAAPDRGGTKRKQGSRSPRRRGR